MRAVVAVLAFCCAGVVHATHCAGNNSWATSGGGSFVAAYNDPKWAACMNAVGRHESFESWVGAQYGCQGTYPKPSGGSAFIRIYRCVKTSAAAGYCIWADAPQGSPSGHEDTVSTAHGCVNCSVGFHWTGEGACVLGSGDGCNYGAPDCEACGNPVHGATGNKYQKEVDYTGRGDFALRFERSYNSFIGFSRASLGAGWRSNYDRVLKVRPYGSFGTAPYQWIVGDVRITATRADGKELTFTGTVDAGTGYQLPDGTFLDAPPFAAERLEKTATGFALYTADDEVEIYSAAGKLQSVTDRAGRTQVLEYDASGRLAVVRDADGRTLALAYNAQGRLSKMTDPAGGEHHYAYDAAGRLTTVTFPDATYRTYLYESASIAHLLTGIVDENGDRYASWSHDALGRAVGSEHAGGAERVTLDYNADGTTTVLDALGQSRRLGFANIAGLLKLADTAVSCPGCEGHAENLAFDAAGNVEERTDANGNVTRYAHDARHLETSRTQAAGTALARTIATQWHDTLRVPVRIDEPGRSTTFTYDARGNRLSRTIRDAATGEVRTTRWTYDARGRVLTVDGPRSVVVDVTTYAYNDCTTGAGCGQVRSITNALGQATLITAYDAHGNPLTIVDANGVATTLAYDARQRLTSRTVAGATTRYEYDAAGQLVRVTAPGGAWLAYGHDAAHRTTAITDSLGNHIRYTLDAMGNRIAEETFDPAGVLKRRLSQDFDALGRLAAVGNAAGEVVTRHGYDARGNRTSRIDFSAPGSGHATALGRDAFDRVVRVEDPARGVARYAYDALDQLASVTDPAGQVTRYQRNALGDLAELASPDTGSTRYTYDAAGNRTSQADARGVVVSYTYDALNRLVSVDYPDEPGGSVDVTYSYDDASQPYGKGRLTGIVDASGATTLVYDARGNVTEERRIVAGRFYATGYAYDAADRLVRITYPSGRAVDYGRDASGAVSEVASGTGTLARDIRHLPFGPVNGFAMGNGIVVERTHDADYRLAGYQDGAIQQLRLYYDLRGNIEATENVLDPARSQSFGYDPLSRLTSAEGRYGLQAFAYDSVGNRLGGASLPRDAGGNVLAKDGLTLAYGVAGRLQAVMRGSERIGEYAYNAAGQRAVKTARSLGPDYVGMAEAAEAAALAARQQEQALESQATQYDAQAAALLAEATRLEAEAAALREQAGQARAEAAAYLEEAQPYLAKAAEWQRRAEESREAAELETGGHREALLRKAEREEARAAEYRAKAQPYLDLQQAALERAAQLDQQAQALLAQAQAARAEAQRLADLARDARVQAQQLLAQAAQLDEQAAEYRRLAQEQEQAPPVTTHFVYDRAGALLGEYRDGAPVREYAWLEGEPLALFVGGGAEVHWFHNDHLHTPQKLSSAGGEVVWDASYEPFGRATVLAGAVEQPLRFPGQYFDAETGLHQNWHRDYDPSGGRYLQSDPIGLRGGLNTYAYVLGNPIRFVDPRGLDTAGCDGIPDGLETPCRLECCAGHDECFNKNSCTSSSWYSKCSKECDDCNSSVRKCIVSCGWSGEDDPAKPNYYCAKQKRYIKIPGDFADYKTAKAACEFTAPSPAQDEQDKQAARPPRPDPKEIFRGVP